MTQRNTIDTMREVMRDINRDMVEFAERKTQEAVQAIETAGNLPPGQRRAYVMAGKATFTIQSPQTQTRFTYRVSKPSEDTPYFVSVLTGDDNENSYSYIGIIGHDGKFRTTTKSRFGMDAPSVRAFGWFSVHFESQFVSVWHDGRCGRCGRKLTVPSSINAGIGPDCAEKGGF